MSSPDSSEYLPLQAYHGDVSSIPATQTIALPPVRKRFVLPPPISEDRELAFLRIVGRNNVHIAPFADIQLTSPEWQNNTETRSGLTMQVHQGTWNAQSVALKRIKRHVFDEGDAYSQANAMRNYHQAMVDQSFELQIMSKASLREHRNIVTLLAVTFDPAWTSDADPTGTLVLPILVVEHADVRFPDLSLFLNRQHNTTLPTRLSFETAASLIADIADGMAALHAHDIVHADLKPANVLIFADNTTRCGLVAKVADFGLSGMVTYRQDGLRVPGRDPPRGGTVEWDAPECAGRPTPPIIVDRKRKETPYELPSRDVYSFGLLASYIALDGQTPKQYIRDLAQTKQSDKMINIVNTQLKTHHGDVLDNSQSIGSLVSKIVEMTLVLDHGKRMKNLGDIRLFLFSCNPYEHKHPTPIKFFLNFNTIPDSPHQFKCEGLYRAYWQSPPAFRERVRRSVLKISSGKFPQYVSPGVVKLLEEPDHNDPVVNEPYIPVAAMYT
ncbi:kinase-like domain-containing protein [Collybia nuda]|uniref:Kinase-like domain-containing protein n=1 Tax=Collybia nuda TaxID=64659 RepID=A0A9P5Y0X8_9AGAR|nr:kinase-like domain-containing protein [Collybia nuda]